MTMAMTNQELEELLAATPGPWGWVKELAMELLAYRKSNAELNNKLQGLSPEGAKLLPVYQVDLSRKGNR